MKNKENKRGAKQVLTKHPSFFMILFILLKILFTY